MGPKERHGRFNRHFHLFSLDCKTLFLFSSGQGGDFSVRVSHVRVSHYHSHWLWWQCGSVVWADPEASLGGNKERKKETEKNKLNQGFLTSLCLAEKLFSHSSSQKNDVSFSFCCQSQHAVTQLAALGQTQEEQNKKLDTALAFLWDFWYCLFFKVLSCSLFAFCPGFSAISSEERVHHELLLSRQALVLL